MSIGTQFLNRLNEAKSPAKKFTFDRGTEAMKRAMRDIGGENNFADKIAEVMNMMGVPGMYLNKPEVRESVIEAASTLRSKPARTTAFHNLHAALASYKGVMKEAKEQDLEGQGFQQLVEEILVSLGLPESMATADAAPAIKTGIKRSVQAAKSDAGVRSAFIVFAQRAGIKLHDSLVGAKKDIMAQVNAKKASVAESLYGEADPKLQVKTVNANNMAGKAIAMIKALGLPLDPLFVRNLSKPNEQKALNDKIMANSALKRAVNAYTTMAD